MLPVAKAGGGYEHYVLEFSTAFLASPQAPGRLLHYTSRASAPAVLATDLVSPSGMVLDPSGGAMLVTEFHTGQIVRVPFGLRAGDRPRRGGLLTMARRQTWMWVCVCATSAALQAASPPVGQIHGTADFDPGSCDATFPDVDAASPLCPWIEQLVADGISEGCGDDGNGGTNFCPDQPVTRGQTRALSRARHAGHHRLRDVQRRLVPDGHDALRSS